MSKLSRKYSNHFGPLAGVFLSGAIALGTAAAAQSAGEGPVLDRFAGGSGDLARGSRVVVSDSATLPIGVQFRISQIAMDGDAARAAFLSAVAYNAQANEYLVTWVADGLATDNEFEIFAQRLSATGTELGGDFRVSTTGTDGDAARGA
ncbi:MAG: hypothetical protein ACREVR_07175, partial [Burkholderiales bacterium]